MKYTKQCNCESEIKLLNPKIESDLFSHKIGVDEKTVAVCTNCGAKAKTHPTKQKTQ